MSVAVIDDKLQIFTDYVEDVSQLCEVDLVLEESRQGKSRNIFGNVEDRIP